MIRPILTLVLALSLPAAAMAGDPRRDAVLAEYAAQAKKGDPTFTAFSAQRGETLFRAQWAGAADPRATSCTSCHTNDPKQPGQNAKTGRPINPVAVSINSKRFTDISETEKQFGRDCKTVIGRDCTATEKGDYITFMAGQ